MREEGSTVKAGSFSEGRCTALLPFILLYQVRIHIIQFVNIFIYICIYV